MWPYYFPETVSHWGLLKKIDVSETLANLSTVLSEKIQDVRKQFKRRALAMEF